MKIHPFMFKTALVFGTALVLAIFITRPAYSQEAAKKETQKKIVLKIISDDNGKTTVIDTTFENPDPATLDSVRNEINKVIVMGKGKHGRLKFRNMPEGFNYNFEMPDIPECPMDMKDLENFEVEGMSPGEDSEDNSWDQETGTHQHQFMHQGSRGQSLSDVLGNIPMDRVTGYSIKDRKHGKRITIDVMEAPMFERNPRVMIIREPGHRQHAGQGRKQIKVYVNTDKDGAKGEEKDDKQLTAPAPPPPPPAPQPDKTSPKKPKI